MKNGVVSKKRFLHTPNPSQEGNIASFKKECFKIKQSS